MNCVPCNDTSQPPFFLQSHASHNHIYDVLEVQLEQLECLRYEDTPATSWLPKVLSLIGSQVEKIIDLELKTLHSGHDFQSQGWMTLKI